LTKIKQEIVNLQKFIDSMYSKHGDEKTEHETAKAHQDKVNSVQKPTLIETSPATTSNSASASQATSLAKACVNSFFETIPPNFCWKKGADFGVIPTGCPSGFFRYLALCFQNCKSGYSFDGGLLCIKACPPDTTTYPLTCTHWSWLAWEDWTVGRDPYFTQSLTNFDSRIPCPAGMYKGAALCYRDCAKIGLVNCGIGMCASSSASCASGIAEMAIDVISGIAQGVAFVLSFGTSSAAAEEVNVAKKGLTSLASKAAKAVTEAAKTMKNIVSNPAVRSDFLQKVQDKAIQKIGTAIDKKIVQEVCGHVGDQLLQQYAARPDNKGFDPKSLDVLGVTDIVDKCSSSKTGPSNSNGNVACAKSVLDTISVIDPTGLASVAAAFMQPTCDV